MYGGEKGENKTVNENIETRALTLNYAVRVDYLLLLFFFFISKGERKYTR